jgi:Protein of unknown function (DUF732)
MFTGKRNVGFLGWAASAVATLAVAAGASAVVPQLVSAEEPPPAVTSDVSAVATVETPAAVEAAAAAPVAEVAAPEVVVPEPETVVTAPPVTKAPRPKVTVAPAAIVEAPAPAAAPAPAPAVPLLAPRTVPSAGQVQSAIAGITGLVQLPFFFQLTPAHVAQVGNQVCTAFDQGQTFAQVKATGLSMVSAYVAVTPAAADYAVRTAVALYCPAYASKLV